ncbi:MAG: hypothetical protein ACMUHY_06470 [Thermoplasmatota archaeon]
MTDRKMVPAFAAAAFLLATALLIALPEVSASETISLTDGIDDVMRTGYVDTRIGGNPELDIVSLASSESISDVTVVMSCSGNIEDSVGYLYTITVSGIHISYQEGAFDVWRIGSEIQRVDNVLTDVSGSEMSVIVKKTSILGDFIINCTSNRYAVDWTQGAASESYYDRAGEIEGASRAPPVGGYTKTYEDPEGDVRLIYLDIEPVEEDGLDIIGVTMNVDQDIEIILELGDDPLTGGDTTYTVYMLNSRIIWTAGEARLVREDEPSSSLESDVDGSVITIDIPSDRIEGELGGVVVQARRTVDESTYEEDLLPDDPYTISELLPFPPGSARSLSLIVNGPRNILMERSYSGFSAQAEEDIRNSMDADDDGSVSEGEVEDFLEATLVSILSDHIEDLTVDGRTGDMAVTLMHEGLVGSVGSGAPVVITWSMNFTFDIRGEGPHMIELGIEHFDPRLLPSPGIGEEEARYDVIIEVSQGWSVNPLSLEPPELANDMDLAGRSIEHSRSGEDAREFDAGSIRFRIGPVTDQDDDDDTEGEVDEDLTWLYVLILVIMVVVIAGIVIWSRREEP